MSISVYIMIGRNIHAKTAFTVVECSTIIIRTLILESQDGMKIITRRIALLDERSSYENLFHTNRH